MFVVTPPPTVASFSPGSGITGSDVTITGTNLSGATSVKFGSLAASFTVVSGTADRRDGAERGGRGQISVTTPAGPATSSTSFTPTLSITSLSPTSGPFGTVVAIRGIGFTPGSTVKFNGTAATVTYVSSGEVKATVPVGGDDRSDHAHQHQRAGRNRAEQTTYTVTPHIAADDHLVHS